MNPRFDSFIYAYQNAEKPLQELVDSGNIGEFVKLLQPDLKNVSSASLLIAVTNHVLGVTNEKLLQEDLSSIGITDTELRSQVVEAIKIYTTECQRLAKEEAAKEAAKPKEQEIKPSKETAASSPESDKPSNPTQPTELPPLRKSTPTPTNPPVALVSDISNKPTSQATTPSDTAKQAETPIPPPITFNEPKKEATPIPPPPPPKPPETEAAKVAPTPIPSKPSVAQASTPTDSVPAVRTMSSDSARATEKPTTDQKDSQSNSGWKSDSPKSTQ